MNNLLHIGEVTAVDMLRFVCGNGFQGNHPFRHSPPIFQEILDQRHIDGFAICAWLHAVINDDLNLPGLVVQKGWKKPIDDPRHCVFAQPTTKPFQISLEKLVNKIGLVLMRTYKNENSTWLSQPNSLDKNF